MLTEKELKEYGIESIKTISEVRPGPPLSHISPTLIIKYINGNETKHKLHSYYKIMEVKRIILKELTIKNRKKKLETICGRITEEKPKS